MHCEMEEVVLLIAKLVVMRSFEICHVLEKNQGIVKLKKTGKFGDDLPVTTETKTGEGLWIG